MARAFQAEEAAQKRREYTQYGLKTPSDPEGC